MREQCSANGRQLWDVRSAVLAPAITVDDDRPASRLGRGTGWRRQGSKELPQGGASSRAGGVGSSELLEQGLGLGTGQAAQVQAPASEEGPATISAALGVHRDAGGRKCLEVAADRRHGDLELDRQRGGGHPAARLEHEEDGDEPISAHVSVSLELNCSHGDGHFTSQDGCMKTSATALDGKHASAAPEGYHTINPWIIPKGATDLIAFLERVYGAVEVAEARIPDADGLLIHAEVRIGDTTLMLFDSKPDWPATPSFLQVYVDDVEPVLARAQAAGAEVVTRLSEFVYGERIARLRDPWGNVWWLNDRRGAHESRGEEMDSHVYDSLLDAMRAAPVRTDGSGRNGG
jgi:PhnB protein